MSALAHDRRVELFGVDVAALTLAETVDYCESLIGAGGTHHHVSLNAAKVVKISTDERLRLVTAAADIVSADGMSIVWGGRVLGRRLPERVAGIDLMEALLARAAHVGHRVYFLGGEESVVAAAACEEARRYPGLRVAGFRNGFWAPDEEEEVVAAVAAARADILFVALPTPRKEEFAERHRAALNVRLVVGVGGSFDVVAGRVPRAPEWMRKSGLEWLHRLLQEPGRMAGRYFVGNTMFLFMLTRELLRGREWSRTPRP